MTLENDSGAAAAGPRRAAAGDEAPVVIEARGIGKDFRVPEHRVDSFKERAAHPFTRVEYRQLQALRDVSFDIRKGEFFGIVGRNGSGKSTLLKVLASIYRADAGTIRMAGRLAPFIELGVGFNPELTAHTNGVLNGVLMGLTKRESRRRLDAVLEFAELEDFAELKLKNYSSGMMVRLAFAVMVQADADIMLVDEVLAVGDAAFAQKCMDVFHERRRAGKTIVLVTHDMPTVQSLCDRAMLLHDGELVYEGDPEETALRYFRMNFAGVDDHPSATEVRPTLPDFNVGLVDAQLRNAAGEPVDNVEQGEPIALEVSIEARRELESPLFVIHAVNEEGTVVFGFQRRLSEPDGPPVAIGQRMYVSGKIENTLVPGSYSLDCWVSREGAQGDLAVQGLRLLDFVVYGTAPRYGLVSVDTDIEVVAEGRERGR